MRYFWADGQLELSSAYTGPHHLNILQRMINDGRISTSPESWSAGYYTVDDFHPDIHYVRVDSYSGFPPSEEELDALITRKVRP